MRYITHLPAFASTRDAWPAVLLLHGYGENEQSLAEVAKHASSRGYVAIAVAGPEQLVDEYFHWPTDHAARTHEYLQSILTEVGRDVAINPASVLLVGFSQGALHAVVLLATYSNFYSGAVAFSPGGWLEVPRVMSNPESTRRLILSYGADEDPGTLETIAACQQLWQSVASPLRVVPHDEGHGLPHNWSERLDEIIEL